jgi:hypothetical protein
MSTIDRRTLLGGLAATPLIAGLERLFGREPALQDKADWLAEALARMKTTNRWGVVIVPFDDPDFRVAQGRGLYAVTEVDEEDGEAHDLFCQAVFISLPAAVAKATFPEAEGANRILLDPSGRPIFWDKAGLNEYVHQNFSGFFRDFIQGPDGARLVERAKAIEAGLSEELKRAAVDLGSELTDARVAAAIALGREIETIAPYVAWLQRMGPTEGVRRQAKLILRRFFATFPAESAGRRLPYGTYFIRFTDSCGTCVPADSNRIIGCGMGYASKRTHKFVSFLPK